MNVSNENAAESLKIVREVAAQTRKAVAASYAAPFLIMWGVIWILGFGTVHLFGAWGGYFFIALDVLGVGMMIWMIRRWKKSAPTRLSKDDDTGWRVFWLWAALAVFVTFWVVLLWPLTGIQICVFACTAGMYVWVMMGLWFKSNFMIWLGLLLAALTVLGYYVFTSFFNLWMGVTGGGALMTTGLYFKIRWR